MMLEFVSRQTQKRRDKRAAFLRENVPLANQLRLPPVLSARRSIGSTITLVPTLTRE